MPLSVLDEILRARLPIRPGVLARWQHEIRTDVKPALEKADEPKKTKTPKTEAA